MYWSWWVMMAGLGLFLGFIGAWSTNAARVFMKTLAPPGALLVARLILGARAPGGPALIFLDFVLIETFAFAGDYLLGLKLGRHDREGYRHDSVGH